MIRTLVILLFLAKAKGDHVIYAVMLSTVVTTVCGMWLAYGEPPNLIMKSNLHPHLDLSLIHISPWAATLLSRPHWETIPVVAVILCGLALLLIFDSIRTVRGSSSPPRAGT